MNNAITAPCFSDQTIQELHNLSSEMNEISLEMKKLSERMRRYTRADSELASVSDVRRKAHNEEPLQLLPHIGRKIAAVHFVVLIYRILTTTFTMGIE